MRERLDRLMKKLPDGSYEVVGYQKHENGKIYHNNIYEFEQKHYNDKALSPLWRGITICDGKDGNVSDYIPHDRIDQCAGVNVGCVKVFERDQGLLDGHVLGDMPVTVIYSPPSFKTRHEDGVLYELNEYFYKLTGIEGVTNQ